MPTTGEVGRNAICAHIACNRTAKERSGVPLKFKDLRDFFAESMISLGVQTIYIDAMAGRAPASVLAKHYVDLSPQKLKQVYDQAGLLVLRCRQGRTAESQRRAVIGYTSRHFV